MDRTKVIEKIKKCLALSQSDNPNEAATALRQAHALMQKHSISERETAISDITLLEALAEHKRMPEWAIYIVNACGQAFQCVVLFRPALSSQKVGAYQFYGTAENADLATYAYAQVSRAHQAARKRYEATLPPMSTATKRRELKSFSIGWAHAVTRSIADFAKSFSDSDHCRLIYAAIESQTEFVRTKRRASRVTQSGYMSGEAEGAKVALRSGLGSREGRLALTQI